MSCGSCGTKEGGGCSSAGSCSKLDVYDWLQEMEAPKDGFDAIEVKFKGGRKEFYRNVNNLNIITGDAVVVESSPGHDVGFVSASGEIVRLQMRKKKTEYNDELKVIYRKATDRDLEKFKESSSRDLSALYKTREIVKELGLGMKMADIEFQGDNTKATFYYSAEDRVDFRELIKRLASEFKVRVEMRQISLRQEAGRLGGIGSCGRELCCSTWLTDFKNVGTSAARYQNLSLNPSKLSGQCGRLKCCLNYELDTYMDALKTIPKVKKPLKTARGEAKLQKTDIFKQQMWFSFEGDSNWYTISAKRVKEIQTLNEKGEKPYSLDADTEVIVEVEETLNSDISQLDKKYTKKNFKKKPKNKPRRDKKPLPTEKKVTQKTTNKPKAKTAPQQKQQKPQPLQNKNKSNTKVAPQQKQQKQRQKPEPKNKPHVATKQVTTKAALDLLEKTSQAKPPKGPKTSKFKRRMPKTDNDSSDQK